MLGHDLLKYMELTMKQVQHYFRVSQDRKRSYAELKRTPREFLVGENVYVKVKPNKISLRLGIYSNLTPTYCGPFEILEKVGAVAYQLALPPTIKVHNIFHVSTLNKYIHDATNVIE